MTVRAVTPDDAPAISAIAFAQGLPAMWSWPDGHAGRVAEHDGRVVAFCALSESAYGLIVSELWDEPSRRGHLGLAALREEIEREAQRLADRRGVPLQCGGIVRVDHEAHIAALSKRGYFEEAKVMAKVFTPGAAS
jgi:hypothetical protein